MVPFWKSASTTMSKTLPLAFIWLLILTTTLHAVETATTHFKGKVTDPDGKPLSQVKVMINRVSGASIASDVLLNALTDNNGSYDLELPFQPAGQRVECE